MKGDNLFRKANKLFKRKKYTELINHLEPKITLYRSSFKYFYLLGMSCLFRKDWGSSYSYLKSAYRINPHKSDVALAYGIILVRQGEPKEGLDVLLQMVEKPTPGRRTKPEKKAAAAIEMIRKSGNSRDIVEVLETSRFTRYLPAPPVNFLPFILLFVLLLSIGGGVALFIRLNDNKPSRDNIKAIKIDVDEKLSNYSQLNYHFLLTDKQITNSFNRIKKALESRRDNEARLEINRILNSNTSSGIQQKALALARHIQRPEMKKFNESYSFEEVYSDPILYNRCYVKWKGRISDIAISPKNIQYNFLVGYHDKKVVEGIVPALMEFEYLLNSDFAYEILARIELFSDNPTTSAYIDANKEAFTNKPDESNKFLLRVVTIRRINP